MPCRAKSIRILAVGACFFITTFKVQVIQRLGVDRYLKPKSMSPNKFRLKISFHAHSF